MRVLRTILSRFLNNYLNIRIVFLMDLALSVLASALVVFIAGTISESTFYRGLFSIHWIAVSFIASFIAFYSIKSHRIVIRHFALRDLAKFGVAVIIKDVIVALEVFLTGDWNLHTIVLLFSDAVITIIFLISARVIMVVVYDAFRFGVVKTGLMRVCVYGTSDKAVSLVLRLRRSLHFKVVAFLSPNPRDEGHTLANLPILSVKADGPDAKFRALNVSGLLFPTDSDARDERNRIVPVALNAGLKIYVAPSIDEMDPSSPMGSLRQINIEDLLGREEIKISLEQIKAELSGKVVMVTGAAGSIGSELVRQLAGFGVSKIVLFDNAETPMHNLRLELEHKYPSLDFVPVIGDVRHINRVDYVMREWHPQVVFHAAAYKHVPLMEENPCEAVLANVAGTRNVADKCLEYDVEKMVMISTDKAVNPTNIMGCTKRLAEIYVQSLGLALEQGLLDGNTRYVTTRFGNVLGSNGSVIPYFKEQIAHGGPITVTHPDINRFFMTIPEACRLVMEAATLSTGNQIFVFDMGESVKIDTLARRMIELAGLVPDKDIKIVYTGLRPGEKLYEEVLSNLENTEPTTHDRIRVARIRPMDYEKIRHTVQMLERFAREVNIPDMVVLMKETVPEFISNNSKFEKYDKHYV